MNWKFWKNWFARAKTKEFSFNEAVSASTPINHGDYELSNQEAGAAMLETVIPTVYITETLFERTRALLADFAETSQSEGVVYWFGFELGESAVVTTLIVPDADTSWGCIRTTPQANAQALSAIVGTPLMLLGQAHSHPGSGVRHSPTDDRDTFAGFDGAISVVVPHYGREGIDIDTCGIHRHTRGAFRYIAPADISEHIRVIRGESDFRRKARDIS